METIWHFQNVNPYTLKNCGDNNKGKSSEKRVYIFFSFYSLVYSDKVSVVEEGAKC